MADTIGHPDHPAPRDTWRVPAGVLTVVVVFLAFLAFDDITTDNATGFPLEYSVLVGCGAWCAVLAARLARAGRFTLGAISIVALGAVAWGQRAIGPGTVPSLQAEYVATMAGMVWFFALALGLILQGILGRPAGASLDRVSERFQ
jgi:hypothetical protein